MRRLSSHLLSVVLFIFHSSQSSNATFPVAPQCHPHEGSALFQFRTSLSIDTSANACNLYNKVWNASTNCCGWSGVTCDQVTGHVIGLELFCNGLRGVISPNSSLFLLRHLHKLDLADNDFEGSSRFHPIEISLLSKLTSFQIARYESNEIRIGKETFRALAQNWSNLRQLDLNGVDLSLIPSIYLLNLSSSLTLLYLGTCNLSGELPENVQELDLSENEALTGSFPKSNWTSPLQDLYLSDIQLSIDLPHLIKNARSLSYLFLSHCQFVGSYPALPSNLSKITMLDLSRNKFSGQLPWSSLNLDGLYYLDLSYNNFIGQLPEVHGNSSHNLSSNGSVGDIPSNLDVLLLSNNLLDGTIPSWVFALPNLKTLDLSHNAFTGEIRNVEFEQLSKSNLFSGEQEPLPWKNLEVLDLRSNLFSGPLPLLRLQLSYFLVSSNQFSGEIPISICNLTTLEVLDLSYNNLHGNIPQCMGNSSRILRILDLRSNKLNGSIVLKFAKGSKLRDLNLNGNQLEGQVPRSLRHCINLQVLDLGNNLLEDKFPYWLEPLPNLQVLVLRSNKFRGSIASPKSRYPFQNLRIMDLSTNDFSGVIPLKFFENFKAMMNTEKLKMEYMGDYYYKDSVRLIIKGSYFDIVKIQTILTTIDFSSNNFTGEIPESIGRLKSLKGLNFSHNKLTGTIPSWFGNLTDLEWLDLSSNELVGKIPDELASITSLELLNLSHNHLEGPIPHGNQFNTFPNDSFSENLGLCGFPLSKKCSEDTNVEPSPPNLDQEDDSNDTNWFDWRIVSMGYASGLVIGISIGYVLLYSDGKLSCFCERIAREIQLRAWMRRPKKVMPSR